MAKGYPDFYGQQTFPKHGPIVSNKFGPANVLGGARVVLNTVLGKGLILGGYLFTADGIDLWNTEFYLTIDGGTLTNLIAEEMFRRKQFSSDTGPFYLIDYDESDDHCALSFSPGLTFESDFTFEIAHGIPGGVIVTSELYYTRIL